MDYTCVNITAKFTQFWSGTSTIMTPKKKNSKENWSFHATRKDNQIIIFLWFLHHNWTTFYFCLMSWFSITIQHTTHYIKNVRCQIWTFLRIRLILYIKLRFQTMEEKYSTIFLLLQRHCHLSLNHSWMKAQQKVSYCYVIIFPWTLNFRRKNLSSMLLSSFSFNCLRY